MAQEMGNSDEAQEEGDFLVKTCYFGEPVLTFKGTKKCVMGVRPCHLLGL